MAWKGPTIGQAVLLVFGGLAMALVGCAGAFSLGEAGRPFANVAPVIGGAVMAGGLIASVAGIAVFVGVVIRSIVQKLGR